MCLVASAPSHCRHLRSAATFRSLHTKFCGLAWLNSAVPAQVGCAVWVAAGHCRIPAAGHCGPVAVTPAQVPTVDGGGAVVGDANGGGEAGVPFVAQDVLAFTAANGAAARRTHRT